MTLFVWVVNGFTFAFFLLELVLPCLCHGGFLSLLCRRNDQTSTRLVVPFQLPPWCRHPRCHITPSTSFQSQRQVELDGNNPDVVKVKALSLSVTNFKELLTSTNIPPGCMHNVHCTWQKLTKNMGFCCLTYGKIQFWWFWRKSFLSRHKISDTWPLFLLYWIVTAS